MSNRYVPFLLAGAIALSVHSTAAQAREHKADVLAALARGGDVPIGKSPKIGRASCRERV